MQFSAYSLAVAALAGVATAQSWTQPKGETPVGNPTKNPTLDTQVPKCAAYEVTWTPTTQGTITILLLRGPSQNVIPQYAIAEKIPNTGSFSWTPASDLEVDTTHYGLQLIADSNGQYQYTPQFGISAGSCKNKTPEVSSSVAGYPVASSSSVESVGYPIATNVPPKPDATQTVPVYSTGAPTTLAPSGTGVIPPIGTGNAGNGSGAGNGSETIAPNAAGKSSVSAFALVAAAAIAVAAF